MDAQYLSKNVSDALTEALTSMTVACPDDKVEYMARYLIQYCKRAKSRKQFEQDAKTASEKASKDIYEEENRLSALEQIKNDKVIYEAQLPRFIDDFSSSLKSKQEAMNEMCAFITDFLRIPAAYIAIKRLDGETELLQYCSASPGQEHVVGKKIVKVAEEGDEVPERQGITFDAFKLPEVPEAEAEEETPEGEEPPPKPVPVPLPLIVENVMREKRCKFFGIPKLGAYAAVPLSFESIDHDAGCVVAPPPELSGAADEEGETKVSPVADSPYAANKLKVELVVCIDTIGNYRTFKPSEIKVVEELGAVLVQSFLKAEAKMFIGQTAFFDSHTAAGFGASIAAAISSASEREAAALAAVEALLNPPPVVAAEGEEPAPEPVEAAPVEPPHELFKPYKDADALATLWGELVMEAHPAVVAMQGHVLPVISPVNNLFFVAGILAGIPPAAFRDIAGDINWDIIRTTLLSDFCSKLLEFKPSLIVKVPREATLESIKAFCEAKGVLSAELYPPSLPACSMICAWLTKALAAREAAVNYYKEAKNKLLELVE